MSYVERALRALMRLNIGATLGLVAWLLWASWSVALESVSRTASSAHRTGSANATCQCLVLNPVLTTQQRDVEQVAQIGPTAVAAP
ncbi:hypothetical protein [Variovorax sp. 770b2]|uniref:hypothetical protein n=1 Tax=Variovorax sp. 770b2 TaxID=1566271 RepID=UPI0008E8C2EC|nr:hypothetical protein [Variovorax sp. 770b2]SFQ33161.1 hypothetical protein SAMN03159339_6773 [Variovorax sp. 770b2]